MSLRGVPIIHYIFNRISERRGNLITYTKIYGIVRQKDWRIFNFVPNQVRDSQRDLGDLLYNPNLFFIEV
jgi:hypothetical protein